MPCNAGGRQEVLFWMGIGRSRQSTVVFYYFPYGNATLPIVWSPAPWADIGDRRWWLRIEGGRQRRGT